MREAGYGEATFKMETIPFIPYMEEKCQKIYKKSSTTHTLWVLRAFTIISLKIFYKSV